jgi:hypothetical protein
MLWEAAMAVGEVKKQGIYQWGVYISGHCYGTFGALLDANCFALQMIDRGMCCEVRLYSGEIIKEYASSALRSVA